MGAENVQYLGRKLVEIGDRASFNSLVAFDNEQMSRFFDVNDIMSGYVISASLR